MHNSIITECVSMATLFWLRYVTKILIVGVSMHIYEPFTQSHKITTTDHNFTMVVKLKFVLILLITCAGDRLVFAQHQQTVTIHGSWSPWSRLETDCVKLNETTGAVIDPDVKCGGGVKLKTRSCTNPLPQVTLGHAGDRALGLSRCGSRTGARPLGLARLGSRSRGCSIGLSRWGSRAGARALGLALWGSRAGARALGLARWGLHAGARTNGAVIDPDVKCGGGVKLKTRSCTNPLPQVHFKNH
jgi:hypothetical protein